MPPPRRLDRTEILSRVSLAEVLTAELGPPRTTSGEAWWPSVDPALPGTGKSPPTHIAGTSTDGIEHFKDFASGRSGTAADVVMIRRGVDFATALRALAERVGLSAERPLPPVPDRPTPRAQPRGAPPTAELAEWIATCARRLWLTDHPAATEAREWLTGRGYQERLLRQANIGYDPGARRDAPWPRERRAAHGIPSIAGVTIPLYDRMGTLTYAQTRNLRWTPESRYPKYVNPSRAVTNPAIAYWADPGRHAGRPVIVVEGPTDALAARQTGHDVAALVGAGQATNPSVAAKLVEAFGTDRPFVIMTDPDAAGRLAGEQLVTHLWTAGAAAVHHPPDGDDLAALAERRGVEFDEELDRAVGRALAELATSLRRALTERASVTPEPGDASSHQRPGARSARQHAASSVSCDL